MERSEKNPAPQPAAAPAQLLRSAKHTYSVILFLITVYGILSIVLVYAAAWIYRMVTGAQTVPDLHAILINILPMYGIAFPLFLLSTKNIEKQPPEKKKLSPLKWFSYLLMALGLMVSGNLIGNLVNLLLTSLIGTETASNTLGELIFSDGGYVMAAFAVLGAPVVEELIFRKVLIDRIHHLGDGMAVLISGVFFGLFHGNFSQFFYAMLLGFLLAAVYIKTGNVLYTILLHLSINSIGSFLPLLLVNSMPDDTKQAIINALIGGGEDLNIMKMLGDLAPFLYLNELEYAAALTGIVLLFVYLNDFRGGKPSVIPKGKRFQTAFVNLGSISLLVFCAAQFVLQIAGNA